MLNFFKKSEQGGADLAESQEISKEDINEGVRPDKFESSKQEGEKLKEQTLNQAISDINEYMGVNGKIDPETVELMTGVSRVEKI